MKIQTALALALLLVLPAASFAGWDPDAEKKALDTIEAFKQKDPSLSGFFEKAAGWAVFPTIGKGGIGIGGAHGKGTVFENGKAIGTTTMNQATIGFQLGGQTYSELIFFQSQADLASFKRGNYEFSASASAVAATSGASTTADFSSGVAVFTLTKEGLMYEAVVGGQKFKYKPRKD